LDAFHAELNRIQLQLSDLAEAEHDLITERSVLEIKIVSLMKSLMLKHYEEMN